MSLESIDLEKAKQKVFHYLGYRARSESEVRRHFRNKIPASLLDEVINDLKEKKYIDDYNFAYLFVRSKLERGYGKKAVLFGLRLKGIDNQVVKKTLEEIGFQQELAAAERIVARKVKRRGEGEKEKVRELLIRRGFSPEVIRKIIEDEDTSVA